MGNVTQIGKVRDSLCLLKVLTTENYEIWRLFVQLDFCFKNNMLETQIW